MSLLEGMSTLVLLTISLLIVVVKGDGSLPCNSPDGSNTCHVHINEIYSTENSVNVELFYEGRTTFTPTNYYIMAHSGVSTSPPHFLKRLDCTFNSDRFCTVVLGDADCVKDKACVKPEEFLAAGPYVVALYRSADLDSSNCSVAQGSDLTFPAECGQEAVIFSAEGEDASQLAAVFTRDTNIVRMASLFDNGLSFQRCPKLDDPNQYEYTINTSTPNAFNRCNLPNVTINEVDHDLQFVELRGAPGTSLEQTVLVLYCGISNTSYQSISLDGHQLNDQGYFVIGSHSTNNVDLPESAGWLGNGSNAVALYQGRAEDFPSKNYTPVAGDPRLIDALVYGHSTSGVATTLIAALIKGQHQIEKDGTSTESISRCGNDFKRLNISAFGVASPTPGEANAADCQINPVHKEKSVLAQQDLIVINEVVANDIHHATEDFIELYDGGQGHIDMTNMSVVFYDFSTNTAHEVYKLTGYKTNEQGFFTIGPPNGPVNYDLSLVTKYRYFLTEHLLSLYKDKIDVGSKIEMSGLLDAVLYKTVGQADNSELLNEFLAPPGQRAIIVRPTGFIGNSSISRCYSDLPRLNTAFSVTSISTPGQPNHCELPPVVISEINVHNADGDLKDFVELSSLGVPFFPLDSIVEVHYNGLANVNSVSWSRGFKGLKTDGNGYFVLGSNTSVNASVTVDDDNFVANGASAIALYLGTPEQSQYQKGASVHNESLIDAVCYGTTLLGGKVNEMMLETLTPGRDQVTEPSGHADVDESINRCDTLNGPRYVTGPLTPAYNNVCNLTKPTPPPAKNQLNPTLPDIILNEVNSYSQSGISRLYIELYSHRGSNVSLDNYVLVFYDGQDSLCYMVIDLMGKRTSSRGFFVVGGPDVKNVDLTINEDLSQFDPDAVVLYYAPARWFRKGKTKATKDNAVDAVIFSISVSRSSSDLVKMFGTTDLVLREGDRDTGTFDMSISRCLDSNVMSQDSWYISLKTPGFINNCSLSVMLISELNLGVNVPSKDKFIELSNGGAGFAPLTGYTLVLYGGDQGAVIKVVDLAGYYTNDNGYFLIAGSLTVVDYLAPQVQIVDFEFPNFGSKSAAVAVYRAHPDEFPIGSKASDTDGAYMTDGLVYTTDEGQPDIGDLKNLLKGQQYFILADDSTSFKSGVESISRCGAAPRQVTSFTLAPLTPDRPNDCGPSQTTVTCRSASYTTPKHLPDVFINELDCDQLGADTAEFIELKGAPGTKLDGYVLALFNGRDSKLYWSMCLNGHKINDDGFFLLGSNLVIGHDVELTPKGVIQNGVDAVALFDGRGRSYFYGHPFDKISLRDSIVYSKYVSDVGMEGFADEVMEDGQIIIEDQNFHEGSETISRCLCDRPRTSQCFVLSRPTPGRANICPNPKLVYPFQLKLTNAVCKKWQIRGEDNQTKLFLLKDKIAAGINDRCRCGFSVDYIASFRIVHCDGGVIFQGEFRAVEKAQQQKFVLWYSHFINSTKEVKIGTESFTVDKSCHLLCYDPSEGMHPTLGLIIGVTIVCAIALGSLTFLVIYYLKKRRDGALHFRLQLLEEDDDFVGSSPSSRSSTKNRGTTSVSNFSNPTYSRLTEST